MDEETAKEILEELRLKIAIAQNKSLERELEESYSGKWGLYMLFKSGSSMTTPAKDAVSDKSIVLEAIKTFRASNYEAESSCGTKITIKDLVLIMPMPVEG